MIEKFDSLEDTTLEIPQGLYQPFGSDILIKEIKQDEHKTNAGIILAGAKSLQYCKIGIVYAYGDAVIKPVRLGMTVAYDKNSPEAAVEHKGVNYLIIDQHYVKAALPPENYLEAHVADKNEIRREDRKDGISKRNKIEDAKLEEL